MKNDPDMNEKHQDKFKTASLNLDGLLDYMFNGLEHEPSQSSAVQQLKTWGLNPAFAKDLIASWNSHPPSAVSRNLMDQQRYAEDLIQRLADKHRVTFKVAMTRVAGHYYFTILGDGGVQAWVMAGKVEKALKDLGWSNIEVHNEERKYRDASSKVAVGDIPADVERYVKETEESNPDYDEAKVWAVAWSRYCKYKNPGSEHCHMNTNDYFKNAMESLNKMAARSLSDIADEIRADWKKVYFGAVPYLDAMGDLRSIEDDYGQDSGSSIVAYFLSNASGWKGETAKRVKKELQDMLKKSRKYANDPDLMNLAMVSDGILAEGCPENLEGEDCDKWEANTEKYKDVVKDKHQAGQVNDTTKSEPDNSLRKNPLDPMATWEEGEVDLKDDPRDHESEGSMIPGLEDRLAAESRMALDPMMAELHMLAEGCPDNLDESECKEWESNTEKYKDVVKDKHQAADDVDEKSGKFEKGKPADPTKDMSPEDAAEWKKQNDEHKDKFKTASGMHWSHILSRALANGLITEDERMDRKFINAAQEAADHHNSTWPEGEGFGSSDMTFLIKDALGQAGAKVDFRGGRLTRLDGHKDQFKGASLEESWGTPISKTAADPSGLYGYTRAIQSSCEASIRKMAKTATKLAKEAYRKDEDVAPFLAAHAKRSSSLSAKILVAAMKDIGPKIASEMRKAELKAEALPADRLTKAAARKYGLYGYAAKTASLGLQACTAMREAAGSVTADLHGRKAASHGDITGFLSSHAKEAKCMYSKMLCASYPDADRKTASAIAPTTVGEWLAWED